MTDRRIATQDEFGNWEVDPLYQELMDRLECDSPTYNEEKEENVACGKCRRCNHDKEGTMVTCPKCKEEYTYKGNDLLIFEAEGECHNCYGDIDLELPYVETCGWCGGPSPCKDGNCPGDTSHLEDDEVVIYNPNLKEEVQLPVDEVPF